MESPRSAGSILVIDDDPVSAELVRRRLQKAGYSVDFHEGPFGCGGQLMSKPYDLVLLDVQMPALSGPQLLRFVRQALPSTARVVFHSASDEAKLARLARDNEADGYISKSMTGKVLVQRVARFMQKAPLASESSASMRQP